MRIFTAPVWRGGVNASSPSYVGDVNWLTRPTRGARRNERETPGVYDGGVGDLLDDYRSTTWDEMFEGPGVARPACTSLHESLAAHDQSDYTGLGALSAELSQFQPP